MVKIGDICELKYGSSLPERSRLEGNVPVYGSNGIVGFHNEAITTSPTLIVGRKGSAGKVQYSEIGCFPIDTTYYIDETTLDCNLKWLFYCLSYKDLSKYNKAAAVPGINRNDVYNLMVQFPSLNEQNEIAHVLEQADRARQQRKAANVLTDQFLQSSFLSLFGDPVKNEKGWELDTIKNLAEKYSDGPFGSNLKTEHYTSTGVRIIRLQNIGVNEFKDEVDAYVSLEHYETLKKHSCYPGDVLIGTMGEPNLRACILPSSIKVAINKADCVLFRPNRKKVLAEYVSYLLNIPSFVESVANLVLGQTRGRISMGRLANAKLTVPSLSLQQQFAGIVAQAEGLRKKQRESERELEQLFQALLQKYFG